MKSGTEPRVYVSAARRDLASCRLIAREVLLTLGCRPILAVAYPEGLENAIVSIRNEILSCRAVVHIVGNAYGDEPVVDERCGKRRSFSQIEYDVAVELKKPIYVFVCGEAFAYDIPSNDQTAENDEMASLQAAHRARVMEGESRFEVVGSRDELQLRLHALQARVQDLVEKLEIQRRRLLIFGILVCTTLTVIGFALIRLWSESGVTQRIAKVADAQIVVLRNEIEINRDYIRLVADKYAKVQADSVGAKLTSEQIFDSAVAAVATSKNVSSDDVRSAIVRFQEAVDANPAADFMDRALADYVRRNFTRSAESAAKAGDRFKSARLAAEELVAEAVKEVEAAKTSERAARILEGQALFADRRFAESVAAFDAALALVSATSQKSLYAEVQSYRGVALNEWAAMSSGDSIRARRAMALTANRAALESLSGVRGSRAEWARIQNNLGSVLRDQALSGSPEERKLFLDEAAMAFRAALEVYTKETVPRTWGTIQMNLGTVLSDLAEIVEGDERIALGSKSLEAYRSALDVFSLKTGSSDFALVQMNLGNALRLQAASLEGDSYRETLNAAAAAYGEALRGFVRPDRDEDWARTQSNLGVTLWELANIGVEDDRMSKLGAAQFAFEQSFEVFGRDTYPQHWGRSMINYGLVLHAKAFQLPESQRAAAFDKVLEVFRATEEVVTKESMQQEWAKLRINLGVTLQVRSTFDDSVGKKARVAQSADAFRSSLSVLTRSSAPFEWAMAQHNLGVVLHEIGSLSEGPAALKAFSDSVAAYRATLTVYRRKLVPQDWAATQFSLGQVLAAQATSLEGDVKRKTYTESLRAFRDAIEVFTREAGAERWADVNYHLGLGLVGNAAADPEGRHRFLTEALERFKNFLSVVGADSNPTAHGLASSHVVEIEKELANAHPDSRRR